jgi:hypothetical protein
MPGSQGHDVHPRGRDGPLQFLDRIGESGLAALPVDGGHDDDPGNVRWRGVGGIVILVAGRNHDDCLASQRVLDGVELRGGRRRMMSAERQGDDVGAGVRGVDDGLSDGLDGAVSGVAQGGKPEDAHETAFVVQRRDPHAVVGGRAGDARAVRTVALHVAVARALAEDGAQILMDPIDSRVGDGHDRHTLRTDLRELLQCHVRVGQGEAPLLRGLRIIDREPGHGAPRTLAGQNRHRGHVRVGFRGVHVLGVAAQRAQERIDFARGAADEEELREVRVFVQGHVFEGFGPGRAVTLQDAGDLFDAVVRTEFDEQLDHGAREPKDPGANESRTEQHEARGQPGAAGHTHHRQPNPAEQESDADVPSGEEPDRQVGAGT